MTPVQQDKARQRALLIMKVRSGQLTATQAARLLGVSRKTYYQWEQRGLEAMMAQLQDQLPGRPASPSDPEKETLKTQLRQAQKELEQARQVKELREILDSLHSTPAKKKLQSETVHRAKPGCQNRVAPL
jgi:transposase